ncbi:MAG: MgtC/SapB family protein, partial [Anaerolineales bacterium]|nr:MgtC/SapB family protein [Anaerolineales bacterium]
RIAAQIVSGIGFLGAGAIIKEGTNVHGLTTAACLWGAAAIGMAAGGGYYEIAILTTVIALISLVVLKLAERVYRKDSYRTLIIQTPIEVSASQIIEIVERKQLKILKCDIDRNYQAGTASTKLLMRLHHRGVADKIAHTIISSLENSGIRLQEVHWEQV